LIGMADKSFLLLAIQRNGFIPSCPLRGLW
jgi:hypothetical protein